MKTFICNEMKMKGGCSQVFEGETVMDIAKACGMHFMGSTDEAHREGREMMTTGPSEEAKKEWWNWFNSEWEKKEDSTK